MKKLLSVEEVETKYEGIVKTVETLEEIGLEFVDFKRVSLWGYGAADRGIHV